MHCKQVSNDVIMCVEMILFQYKLYRGHFTKFTNETAAKTYLYCFLEYLNTPIYYAFIIINKYTL